MNIIGPEVIDDDDSRSGLPLPVSMAEEMLPDTDGNTTTTWQS